MIDCLVISDFNVQNLAAILNNTCRADGLRAAAADYGQVMQLLLAPDADTWASHNAAIVWTSPSAVSSAYRLGVEGERIETDKLNYQVAEFATALSRVPSRIQHLLVPTWIPIHRDEDRRGPLAMDGNYGLTRALMQMNLALAEALKSDQRIRLFDATRWIVELGPAAYSPKLWYLSKTPFSVNLFRAAAADFAAAARGFSGKARKLLILDLDNTLWGGIVGEAGWPKLRLGGHDPIGEAYRDFQRALLALRRRGVLLGVVSKNEEAVALEAIREHPEMILRLSDFAGWRINWNDKAQNVLDLMAELNLGRDSAVFIDDHPEERARVREAIPDLIVPEWPNNPIDFPVALRRLDCFDVAMISAEDRDRAASYVSERQRRQAQETAPSLDEWLKTLAMRVEVESLTPANVERVTQLLNKTNQMNLRTRRISLGELHDWSSRPQNRMLTFRVADKFGDYGLVGLASIAVHSASRTASIEDFVLSCRAMGRRVEETMLCTMAAVGAGMGAAELTAEYIATPRNQPCLRFFEHSCMQRDDVSQPLRFRLDLNQIPAIPDCITIVGFAG